MWQNVKKEHVLKAIQQFEDNNHDYPAAKNTFLIFKNKKYPAKHIRWLAYKNAYGKSISKNDFSGGNETASFFRALGFKVEYKSTDNVNKRNIHKQILSVVSQKNAFQKLLQKEYGIIETEKRYSWLKTPDINAIPLVL